MGGPGVHSEWVPKNRAERRAAGQYRGFARGIKTKRARPLSAHLTFGRGPRYDEIEKQARADVRRELEEN